MPLEGCSTEWCDYIARFYYIFICDFYIYECAKWIGEAKREPLTPSLPEAEYWWVYSKCILLTGYHFVHDICTFIYVMIKIIGQVVCILVLPGVVVLSLCEANSLGDNEIHSLSISNWSTKWQGTMSGQWRESGNCKKLLSLVIMERELLCLKDNVIALRDFRHITRQVDLSIFVENSYLVNTCVV